MTKLDKHHRLPKIKSDRDDSKALEHLRSQMMVEGVKHDQGKLRYDLLPSEAVEEIIKVLMFGEQKYTSWNWSKGIKYSRVFAALMRHMWKWHRGETVDEESGLSHLAHAGCCLFFLLSYSLRAAHLPETLDDRPFHVYPQNNIQKTD